MDGWLQLDAERFAAWKAEQVQLLAAAGRSWRCGRLPVVLLAVGRGHDVAGLTPRQLLAAAVLIDEADRERDGIAADAELAARAGCSRNTLRTARAALALAGLLLATRVRRGRSAMVRSRVTKQAWRTALAGLAAMAQLAERHRRGARRRRGKPLNTPPCPYGESKPQQLRQAWGPNRRSADACRSRGVAIADLLAGLGQHMRHHAATTPPPPPRSRYLAQLLTPAALARLAGMNPAKACEEVLMGAGAMSRSPQRRKDAAATLARALGRADKPAAATLVAVLADVLLDRPRDVGAVLAWRCGALARGGMPVNRPTTSWEHLIADARRVVSA